MFRTAAFATLILFSMSLLGFGLVSANGRATLISSQEQGPYRIDVSSLPGQPLVNNTHLSILIVSLASQQPLTTATVNVFATGPAGSTDLGPIPAVNDLSPQFFEMNLPFDMEGAWQVTIAISAEPGEETVVVPMQVTEDGGRINLILVAVAVVVAVTIGIWTWDRIRGKKVGANS